MNTSTKAPEGVAMLGLFSVGILLLVIAFFFDPIGDSPDTGIVDLGPMGTKWLLGLLGSVFIVCGSWLFVRSKH